MISMRTIIELAGGRQKLAAAAGVSRQAVSVWTRVPGDHVVAVSRLTGIPAGRIRPDIRDATLELAAAFQDAAE